jgi:predicted amidohydrolase
MATHQPFLAACIQFNPKLNERDRNIESLLVVVTEAARNGARLIVTPEMATTGYHYQDREAIAPFVDTIPGVTTSRFETVAKQYQAYLVIGMPEVDEATGLYYNSAAIIGPEGYIGTYRKIHLWETEAHWAAWGEQTVAVFETELGKLAVNICMDAVYFESARLAAVQGANILAFLTNSSGQAISTLQARAETNGLYVVSANRSNTERGFHMVGASAIWSPDGEKVSEAEAVLSTQNDFGNAVILYGAIEPSKYENTAKKRLGERRPDLYKELMLHVTPCDDTKAAVAREIVVAALQYEPLTGDRAANLHKVKQLLMETVAKTMREQLRLDVVVLPELALCGDVADCTRDEIVGLAEAPDGTYFQELAGLAKLFGVHLVFGFIEREGEKLYNSAALLTPAGEVVGIYRKTHLTEADQKWAAQGSKLSVFQTETIGHVGIMIGYDAAFPEVAGVFAVKRADLVLIPANWCGEYGREIAMKQGIAAASYPKGSNVFWEAIASGTQAHTIVSNFVGTRRQFKGSSACYVRDPVYGEEQPRIASALEEGALVVRCTPHQAGHWFDQQKLLLSRRTHTYHYLHT